MECDARVTEYKVASPSNEGQTRHALIPRTLVVFVIWIIQARPRYEFFLIVIAITLGVEMGAVSKMARVLLRG